MEMPVGVGGLLARIHRRWHDTAGKYDPERMMPRHGPAALRVADFDRAPSNALPPRGAAWRKPSRIELLLLLLAFAGFVLVASHRIAAPGLYADEMLFAPATLRALGDCGIEANVSHSGPGCFPLYLDPPYLGALKA